MYIYTQVLEPNIFICKNSRVSYYRFGRGNEVLVAFHGYHQSGKDFLYFKEVLAEKFTVIAVDFFWHGQSVWLEKEDFTETNMKDIVAGIAVQENLQAKKISVCSFSMGARTARALVQTIPHHIERLILLSPPTFLFTHFLHFSTRTFLGLRLFRFFVRKQTILLWWVRFLNKAGVLNRAVYIFTSRFISNPERMEKVFKTWYAQRRLSSGKKIFAGLISKHGIKVTLIVGKNDPITPSHRMVRYISRLPQSKILVLDKKHKLATEETKAILSKLFNE